MEKKFFNIRATSLEEFWGSDYGESVFLWLGGKSNCSLEDINSSIHLFANDKFKTSENIEDFHKLRKDMYYKTLPEFSKRMNSVHNLNYSVKFWQLVCGYWLFRHISIVYEKYIYLRDYDIDLTSIKLLNRDDFYIPINHEDYINCFAGEFGVVQLTSIYYYIFGEKYHPIIRFKYSDEVDKPEKFSIKKSISTIITRMMPRPNVACIGTFIGEKVFDTMRIKTEGNLNKIEIPRLNRNCNHVDEALRTEISINEGKNGFELYFWKTLFHCLPRDLGENFLGLHELYLNHVNKNMFEYIVSESWISDIRISLYVAMSKNKGSNFICLEHSACTRIHPLHMSFIDYDVADKYITTGWYEDHPVIIRGGFVSKDIAPPRDHTQNASILIITYTTFIYGLDFSAYLSSGQIFLNKLNALSDLINGFSPDLRRHILFRPRFHPKCWNKKNLLELDKVKICVDKSPFNESIINARIIIIDHLTTGFAEILLSNIPFTLFYDFTEFNGNDKFNIILKDLSICGVWHRSPQTLCLHIESVYDNVAEWWANPRTKLAVENLKDYLVAPPAKSIEIFETLVGDEYNSLSIVQFRFVFYLERILKATSKMKFFKMNLNKFFFRKSLK